jgi:hypothetical protein
MPGCALKSKCMLSIDAVSVALGRQLNGWGHEFRTDGVHDRF